MLPLTDKEYKIKLRTKFDIQQIDGKTFCNKGSFKTLFNRHWRLVIEYDSPDELQFPCVIYFLRHQKENFPEDNDVYYGTVEGLPAIIHRSELTELQT